MGDKGEDRFDGTSHGEADRGDVNARETYRHLRLMLVTLPVLILLAILALLFRGQLEGSISAYYGQPVRDVFVGAMVGTAVCLIVYKGFPPLEDYALNVAGFYAMFVAFVPSGWAENLATLTGSERQDALFGLRASVLAVVAVTALFVFVEWRVGHWSLPGLMERAATRWVVGAGYVVGAAFLGLVVWRGFIDDDFEKVHASAAVLLFTSLAVAVATHGWPGNFGQRGESTPRYRTIFWLMVAGVPMALVVEFIAKSDHTILILEVYEIALFACFWVFEAIRTWPAPRNSAVAETRVA